MPDLIWKEGHSSFWLLQNIIIIDRSPTKRTITYTDHRIAFNQHTWEARPNTRPHREIRDKCRMMLRNALKYLVLRKHVWIKVHSLGCHNNCNSEIPHCWQACHKGWLTTVTMNHCFQKWTKNTRASIVSSSRVDSYWLSMSQLQMRKFDVLQCFSLAFDYYIFYRLACWTWC